MVNLVDLVGIGFFLLIAYIIYKKSWFYSFYSFLKFIFIALLSLYIANFISARNPINLPITKLEESLIFELVLFIVLWRVLNFKKFFFKSAKRIDRFVFVHGLNKVLNFAPALIASLFITFFAFTSIVSASTNSSFLQKELEKSKIVKPVAYKIYSSNIFEGVAVKLDIPTAPTISSLSLEKIRRTIVYGVLRPGVMTIKGVFDPYFTIPALPTAAPLPTIPPPNGTRGDEFEPSPTVIIYKFPRSGLGGNSNSVPNNPNGQTPQATQSPQNPTQTPEPQPNPQPQPSPAPTTDINQVEQDIFRLTNEQRTKNGLPAFNWSDRVASVARAHSQDMNARNFFAHNNPDGKTPFDRMSAAGISFSTAGENIAGGPNADIIVNNWMNSSGHRANILNPAFHTIGIGVSANGRYGLLATQNFTN